ncbi:MAG: GNAT family N-acetyltransferase, partial [Ilumatobacter sp.]|uniref:GNAT family N-acetyltransferase n=1 Tax=Ilumatobacter sp. TaxID=1967498 RepID=UPI003C7179BA
MLTFRDARGSEADELLTNSLAAFVDELVEQGADRDRAADATDEYTHRLMPDGIGTTGHRFRWIDRAGIQVGWLWHGPMPGSPGDHYLFEIEVDEDARRTGVGRQAIQMLIGEVERTGAARLGLNVFDSNSEGLALYRSLGFETVDQRNGQHEMWRRLSTPDP